MSLSYMFSLLTPLHLALALFGSILGIVFGAIPGLGSATAIVVLLPVTFSMPASTGIILLISIYIGSCSGGMISSILLGIPGTAASVATCFDGYPLTKKGQAVKALGTAIVSSFIGTTGSLIIAAFLCPVIARVAVMLGPWELFSLCFCAIILVVTISKGNMWNGLIAGFFGMMISTVGFAPLDGTKRFSFGIKPILGGVNMMAFLVGIFAIAHVIRTFGQGDTKSPDVSLKGVKGFGLSFKEYFSHGKLILKSFLTGLWIGFLPGMGSGLSNIVAYAQAKSSSKHPEEFGNGTIEGVIAPEVANNASLGGAIIPMIALGIPGDTVTSLLLGGLLVHGIEAGPLLMTNSADYVGALFFGAILAAVLVLALEFFGMRTFPFILRLPFKYLFSTIVVLCFLGVYTGSNSVDNLWVAVICTVIGLLIGYSELPLSPLILGYVLGPMIEKYLRRGLTYADNGWRSFLTRPVSAILLLIAFASLFWPFIRDAREKKKGKQSADT